MAETITIITLAFGFYLMGCHINTLILDEWAEPINETQILITVLLVMTSWLMLVGIVFIKPLSFINDGSAKRFEYR